MADAVVDPARRCAHVLTPDNRKGRWVPLDEAISSGEAFFVRVARWVLALDADTAELAAEVLRLAEMMKAEGLSPVVVASGQLDHLHLFVVIPEAVDHDAWSAEARDAGIDVRRDIRPPLAPHRLGLPVTLIDPVDAAEAVARLTYKPTLVPAPPSRHRGLSPRMAALLVRGDTGGEYHSRSEVVQALATAHLNAGLRFERFRSVMLIPTNAGGAKVRESADPGRYLAYSWAVAERFVAENPAIGNGDDARAAIAEVEEAVRAQPWPGRSGGTDRAVMLALCQMGERVGRVSGLHASVRAVAVQAGVGPDTARRSLTRLRRDGWVRLLRKGRGCYASSWALLVAKSARVSHTPPKGEVYAYAERNQSHPLVLDAGADPFRWAALGKQAHAVLDRLDRLGPVSAPVLAGALGLHRSTVFRQLKGLEEVGLVAQAPDPTDHRRVLYRLAVGPEHLPEVLAAVARLGGTDGRRAAEAERYRQEVKQRTEMVAAYRRSRLSLVTGTEEGCCAAPVANQPDIDPKAVHDRVSAGDACPRCGDPLQPDADRDAGFCSPRCRAQNWRASRQPPGWTTP